MAADHNRPATAPPTRQDFMVVGIGASAGGLEAATAFVKALPARCGIAFILVQHLDPSHESMLADLLANHTSLPVMQAVDGAPLEPDNIYVIPPGTYLSVADGALRLSERDAGHGARMPFDFLLDSLARECGSRAVCVVLSGTGDDGSRGLKAVKENGGLVIAQEPEEAGHDGMPRSAIFTGAVDLVLAAADIPDALVRYDRRTAQFRVDEAAPRDGRKDWLSDVIDLIRAKSGHDFSLYKEGTMRRRIERRRALASIEVDDMARYVELIRGDPGELDLLVKDLLINVTSFFRDPQAFDRLAETVLPALVRSRPANQPIRVWVAGCSTGEEAYSLGMLFREQLAAAKRDIKLQIFASDADEDAILTAREGLYPFSIEADVSPERLDRFFVKEERGYRVRPELRGHMVFTVQDVLGDPPFSRLDLMSCRNLLIYFGPEAQAKLVSLCHFALREGGVLMLGRSESAGDVAGRFEPVSKSQRLFRRIGRSRPSEFAFATNLDDRPQILARPGLRQSPNRHAALGDLCRKLVLENYAPAAAVLVDAQYECLYALGSTDRYLRVAPGYPSHDLLSMASHGLRVRLRSAIEQAARDGAQVMAPGGRIERGGRETTYGVAVHPVVNAGERLFLVCFIDQTSRETPREQDVAPPVDLARTSELERELDATKIELQAAIRDLEVSTEEQKMVAEEARSVSEEFQSTNEELLTSKEELQSLNEELTALNSQLQETLERQRTTANDLQNVLYSTDVATLFLDPDLNIRFFTPATRRLFSVIPSDLGRPLADLHALAADRALLTEARNVLRTEDPVEREIEAQSGAWYVRRILPYRSQKGAVEGVVITFVDVTEQRRAADALALAKREADAANAAKSRFLAAASHDLRQPLQALTLLQGLLAKSVDGERAVGLVTRFDDILHVMSGMLNALLDIDEIEAGVVRASVTTFRIGDLLETLKTEFADQAEANGLELRVIPCALSVESDRRLLEQMIRNLLSNALKYTARGRVLLGCRRRGEFLNVEVWDTGIGVANAELRTIFDAYHQVDNPARQRSRGLGLGLSIVKRLGDLLGHRITVRSRPGKGSAFAIEVKRAMNDSGARIASPSRFSEQHTHKQAGGTILIVEDDPDVRNLLQLLIESEGHRAIIAADGPAALKMAATPDVILADYNLPDGMNGVEVVSALRERRRSQIPAIILTGDISTEVASAITRSHSVKLGKPVKPAELVDMIWSLLAKRSSPSKPEPRDADDASAALTIFIVDDDPDVGETMRAVLEGEGRSVEVHQTAEAFLAAFAAGRRGCVLIDAYLPGMDGLELLRRLRESDEALRAIMITGHSDVPMAVQAMKAGALDFIEKPVSRDDLVEIVGRALQRDPARPPARRDHAESPLADLTDRQREILDLILAGRPNKVIAANLSISQRTVENHRAAIMTKTGAKSLPALARLAFTAGWDKDQS